MARGLLAIAEAIGLIGAAAMRATTQLEKAADAAEDYSSAVERSGGGSNTSGMASAGGAPSTMGSSSGSSGEGGAVTGGSNQIAVATALMAEMRRRFR